jgi:hypothetical protein
MAPTMKSPGQRAHGQTPAAAGDVTSPRMRLTGSQEGVHSFHGSMHKCKRASRARHGSSGEWVAHERLPGGPAFVVFGNLLGSPAEAATHARFVTPVRTRRVVEKMDRDFRCA